MSDGSNYDAETLLIYLMGSYVYSVYKDQVGGIDMTGDPDQFFLVLGTIIKERLTTPF